MKNYVSPVIFDNEELAEGVYATGSGEAECWTMTATYDHNSTSPTDPFVVYRLDGKHNTAVKHVSIVTSLTVVYMSTNVTGLRVDGVWAPVGTTAQGESYDGKASFKVTCTPSGATIERTMHANAELSGDTYNISFELYGDSDAKVTGVDIRCTKTDNVNHTAGDELNNN